MQFFEKTISNLIESQFPDVYKENGADFVEFVKAYYEWLEDNDNAVFHARRMLEYRDIDSTIDKFLIYFKNKYLNSIQFDTASDVKHLVKHSLDLYRSKGTERAIDLFFRNIFGTSASVYYPQKDMFKASAGTWIVPKYLEIEVSDNMSNFIGIEIKGIDTGATAFIQSLVKSRSKGISKYSHLYYISNINGYFRSGEKIQSIATGEIGPTILGSLNELEVVEGGIGYNIGDIVSLRSDSSGSGGFARVKEIGSVSGKIDFSLRHGGWGYNSNSEILISNNVLTLTNIEVANTSGNGMFRTFETLIQPTINIHYQALTGQTLNVGDTVHRTDETTNVVFSTAIVVSANSISSTEGFITVSVQDGNFTGEMLASTENGVDIALEDEFNLSFQEQSLDTSFYIYKYSDPANTASYLSRATIASYLNQSAAANIMYISDTLNVDIVNSTIKFNAGEMIYQLDDEGYEISNGHISVVSYSGTNASILIENVRGRFKANTVIRSRTSSAQGTTYNISTNIGIIDTVGAFNTNEYNIAYGKISETKGHISKISTGTGAEFILGSTFLYRESEYINTDFINEFTDVMLTASDYGFPAPGPEDLNTIIIDALTYELKTYGKIDSIILTNPGDNYDAPPYVVIYDKVAASINARDFIVTVSNTVSNFSVGEIVRQNGRDKGIVKSFSGSTLNLERITLSNIDYYNPANTLISELTLVGSQSGATALPMYTEADNSTMPIGYNAVVLANSAFAAGSVKSLQVIDSGISYANGESVEFFNESSNTYGRATALVSSYGVSKGYHKRNDSVLSSNKYLRDGDYYQNFSYEIKTNIAADRYADMLKNIIHIAGTKFFSRYVSETILEAEDDITLEVIKVE